MPLHLFDLIEAVQRRIDRAVAPFAPRLGQLPAVTAA